MLDHVAIIGGGFSGTLQAINLLRHDGPRASLIERRAEAGTGLAYGQAAPDHILNVRAKGMSAFPDAPDDFVRWLEASGLAFGPDAFVPRLVYGDYLRELLEREMARQPARLTLVQGEVTAIDLAGGPALMLGDGRRISADMAILAVGNLPPHDPPGFASAALAPLYAADPWTAAATAGLAARDRVLLLGTGLTMVDMVLRLRAEGFAGPITALSRRGLLPHRHEPQPPFEPITERPPLALPHLVAAVRARAGIVGWRNAVDELRRFTGPLWQAADVTSRQRFVRHLRPWWDIHRHRLAPRIAATIADELASGGLRVMAGATVSAARDGQGLCVRYKPRGESGERSLIVDRAINCTGLRRPILPRPRTGSSARLPTAGRSAPIRSRSASMSTASRAPSRPTAAPMRRCWRSAR